MDQRERIETKLGILVQIAGQYRTGRISLMEATEQINAEMVNLRPAQYEAVKKLFPDLLSPSHEKPTAGHPLSSYCGETDRIRSVLLEMDELEDVGASPEEWSDLYGELGGYSMHIECMEREFYPLLIQSGMRPQVGKARELGNAIRCETADNLERLRNGDVIDFLYHQRSLVRLFMNYLDLEERFFYPKLLSSSPDPKHAKTEFKSIDPSQSIAELFRMYPEFKKDFFDLDEELKGLKGPMGTDLLKDSTIEMLAKSLRIDAADLVKRINTLLKSY